MWAIFDLTPKWDQNYSFIQYNHYILITNTLISSLIPTTWVHPNKNFKIQQNETVKTTYVPNTIRIPTHGVNFSHQGLGFGERTQNRQWSRRKVSRGEGRKKLRRKKEKGRGAIFCRWVAPWLLARLLHEPHRITWCDSIDIRWNRSVSHAIAVGVIEPHQTGWCDSGWRGTTSVPGHALAPWVTPVHMAWFLHESRQPDWHDAKGPDLGNKFRRGSFLDFF
jgi:hypothetical protein